MLRTLTLAAGLALCSSAFALSLADLSQSDASGGLKDALTQGTQVAVQQLGKPGGFSNNPPKPPYRKPRRCWWIR